MTDDGIKKIRTTTWSGGAGGAMEAVALLLI